MSIGLRYKCDNCGWHGYRKNIFPCPRCNGDVHLFPSTVDKTPFTKEQENFIRDNYKKLLYKDIAEKLGVKESRIGNYMHRNRLRLPKSIRLKRYEETLFKPGRTSWNKGLSLPNTPNDGQFLKGHKPANTKSIGTVSVRKHYKRNDPPYLWIKVAQDKWTMLHVYNWEIKYGPVPKNKILRFKDKDTMNCDPGNVELVTRREHLDKNRPEEMKDVITSDNYIAGKFFGITNKKEKAEFIKSNRELIEIKRQQLLLRRVINETGRKIKKHGKQNLDAQCHSTQVA